MGEKFVTSAEETVSRRTLVKGAAATSVVAVAGCMGLFGEDESDDGGDGSGDLALQVEEYPKTRIASLEDVGSEPYDFSYPLEGHRNFLVKLGEPAAGGIGPDDDVVGFNYACTHMGCPMDGTYDDDHSQLGPCGCHMTRFDLTNHGQVIMGHATQDLPQILLTVEGDDIYAVGVTGLIYGYSSNFDGGEPSEEVQQALEEGGLA